MACIRAEIEGPDNVHEAHPCGVLHILQALVLCAVPNSSASTHPTCVHTTRPVLARLPFAISVSALPTIVRQSCMTSDIDETDRAAANGTPRFLGANFMFPIDWFAAMQQRESKVRSIDGPARTKSQTVGTLFFNTAGPGGPATIELVGNVAGLCPFSGGSP